MQSPGGMPSLADVPQSVITAATLMPSSSRPLTEEPRAICLRHDRNQIKKRCTCGKARRYRPGRGYAPAADDARLAAIAEAVDPLCAALRTHTQNARVAEWCCRGLQHALVDAPSRAMVTRQQNGAQLLLLVLRTHATSAKVVREALHALANLSGDEDGDAHAQTALQIARNGGLEVTAQAMVAHQDDARIQALACAVLGHTCRNAPHRREGRAALPHVVRALATPDAFIDVPFDDERCHAMACYALAAVCAGDREAADAAAKLGAPALVDHALRRFAKRASVERWGARAKAALAGPGAAPLGAVPPAGLNIGPPVVAQSVPPAWTPGAFP